MQITELSQDKIFNEQLQINVMRAVEMFLANCYLEKNLIKIHH